MGSEKGNSIMRARTDQAATEATAQSKSTRTSYPTWLYRASRINDILARLLLGLETRHHGAYERGIVAGKIEQLVRSKIDLGFLDRRRS